MIRIQVMGSVGNIRESLTVNFLAYITTTHTSRKLDSHNFCIKIRFWTFPIRGKVRSVIIGTLNNALGGRKRKGSKCNISRTVIREVAA